MFFIIIFFFHVLIACNSRAPAVCVMCIPGINTYRYLCYIPIRWFIHTHARLGSVFFFFFVNIKKYKRPFRRALLGIRGGCGGVLDGSPLGGYTVYSRCIPVYYTGCLAAFGPFVRDKRRVFTRSHTLCGGSVSVTSVSSTIPSNIASVLYAGFFFHIFGTFFIFMFFYSAQRA